MVFWSRLILGVALACVVGSNQVWAQNAQLAVIVGLAGDPEYAELYGKWAAALVDAATGRYGMARERV